MSLDWSISINAGNSAYAKQFKVTVVFVANFTFNLTLPRWTKFIYSSPRSLGARLNAYTAYPSLKIERVIFSPESLFHFSAPSNRLANGVTLFLFTLISIFMGLAGMLLPFTYSAISSVRIYFWCKYHLLHFVRWMQNTPWLVDCLTIHFANFQIL